MTVQELKEELQRLEDQGFGDLDVRVLDTCEEYTTDLYVNCTGNKVYLT